MSAGVKHSFYNTKKEFPEFNKKSLFPKEQALYKTIDGELQIQEVLEGLYKLLALSGICRLSSETQQRLSAGEAADDPGAVLEVDLAAIFTVHMVDLLAQVRQLCCFLERSALRFCSSLLRIFRRKSLQGQENY